MKKLLTSIILLSIISTTFIFPSTNTFAETDTVEEAREDDLLKYLLLDIPEETDNPNFTIIFTDPSEEGVFVSIDSGNERRIENPYVLPSLAIGDHKLTFIFTDKEETEQTVERTLVVVPRAPVIKAPEIASDVSTITVNGTALPNATVKINMSGATKTYKANVVSTVEGDWEYVFTEEFDNGIYAITAFTKKDGYASDYADEIVFKIEPNTDSTSAAGVISEDEPEKIQFSIESLLNSDPAKLFQDNIELIYFTGVILVLGWLLGFLVDRAFFSRKDRKEEAAFMQLIGKGSKESKKTIKENKKEKKKSKKSKKVKKKKRKLSEMIPTGGIKDKLKDIQQDNEKSDSDNDKEEKPKILGLEDLDNTKKEDEPEEMNEDTSQDEDEIKDKKSEKTEEDKDKKEILNEENLEEDSKKDLEEEGETPKQELSKEEFLEKFKDFDPDDETGTEKAKKAKSQPKKGKVNKTEKIKEGIKKEKSVKNKDTKKKKEKKPNKNIKITLTTDSLK
jgi:hypothetical protein